MYPTGGKEREGERGEWGEGGGGEGGGGGGGNWGMWMEIRGEGEGMGLGVILGVDVMEGEVWWAGSVKFLGSSGNGSGGEGVQKL